MGILSPISSAGAFGHAVLDVLGLIPGPVGVVADITNAAWYAIDGDLSMAGLCVVSAIPGMDLVGKASKYAATGGKYARAALYASNMANLAANATTFARAGMEAWTTSRTMYSDYIKEGKELSWNTVLQTGTLALNVGTMLISGKSGIASGNTIKKQIQNDLRKNLRRKLAKTKLANAANGSQMEGVLIGKDGDVPVHQSQEQLKKSITDAGAKYIGSTRNNDGQIYHINTPYGPREIRIMKQKDNQINTYLDNRTVIVEQGSVGNGTGTYTYGNGAPIRGAISKNERKAIGHTHGQTQ